jgi:hypothetical protein
MVAGAEERPGNFCGKKSLFWQLCESSYFRCQNFSANGAQIPLAIFQLQRKISSL